MTHSTGDDMNHRERVLAALRGEEVDRPPVSMWRHFFEEETSAEGLAEAMLGFQRRFDWDFMKLNPRASYHAEDWGLKVRYGGGGSPEVVETPVHTPEDWRKLEVLPPDQAVLGEQLRAVELIAKGLPPDVPFLMTVFTPMSIVGRLVSSEDVLLEHIREDWESVLHALEVVTETFIRFSRACLDRGASGLFYATTSWGTKDRMTAEDYRKFCRPHDLKLLGGLPDCEFHLLHVCKDDNLMETLTDYPVHAFNWDAKGAGNLSLSEGKAMAGGKAAVGGLDQGPGLIASTPAELAAEVRGLKTALGKRGWMTGTGCTFPPEVPEANLDAIRQEFAAGV